MPVVLIVHPRLIPDGPHHPLLRQAGFEIRLPPAGADPMQPEVLSELIRDADAAVAGLEPFNREVISSAPQLRVVARCGVGFETVDVEACDERHIAVTTTPGTNEHSVAEHALAMMFALSRGFPGRDLVVRNRRPWKKVALPRLAGRTVGIVGLGRIGKALAMRLPSLQVQTIAYESYPDQEFNRAHGIELTSLEELLARSDFVSLHVPVTSETEGMINRERLALMKSGAVLVNTARGALVNEQDLHRALVEGRLAAAGLDVLVQEPPADDHPLLELENVLFSPHAAGMDEQSHHDSVIMLARTLTDLYQGRWPAECVVNLKHVNEWMW